jgi:glycosyltransferase involved in cell wall biosynthesis
MRNALVIPRTAALVDVVRRFRPTHIHAHWGGASSTIALVAAEATDVPWSMTLHRWDIHADNQLARKIASACFTRTVSESGAAAVRSIVPEAETAVIHMGVDLETVAARPTPSSACRLVCIGGLVPVKNHSELLRSFAQVVSEQDARLDLVGSGPLANDLRSLSASLGIEGKVRFLGVVAHDELLARLRRREWDGVVLASTASGSAHEGIPVSLMEAMAAGVPVIATDSGGTHELLTGRAGILVPLDDRPALVETLLRFVSDRELREQLSSGGRRRVADAFDVRVIAADLRHRFATCAA